jgi:Domain of unknown function (DUF5658)
MMTCQKDFLPSLLGFSSTARRVTPGTTVDYVNDGMSTVAFPSFAMRQETLAPVSGWLRRSLTFGNVAIVAFLVVQALDGMFTYVGIVSYGPAVEGNPLLSWMMGVLGAAPALAGAKFMASIFGIVLHLTAVHRTVALLAILYVSAAILPWVQLLFWQAAR